MAIISDCICWDIFAFIVAACIGVFTYFKRAFKYWERRNVPYIEPSFPFGTISNPFWKPEAFGEQTKKQYDEFKARGYKHGGLFGLALPIYMPVDPKYIKNIMARDFNHFVDRGVYFNEKDDPLSAHLFAIEGTKWRNLRAKLTPTFTSGKMKMMFHILVQCSDQLRTAMDDVCSKKQPVDIKDMLGRFTVDVIGSCAFGLDCDSFTNPNSDFRKYAKRVFHMTPFEQFKSLIAFTRPNLARSLGMAITPKESSDFFRNVIASTVNYREKNDVMRKDFMQLLIGLKNNIKIEDAEDHEAHLHDGKSLTIEELSAQAFVFFIAGFETSSTTMTFCLFELAVNPEIQDRVREEVNAVLDKHDGQLTYDGIMDMKYMGQVVDETLRKYPPLPSLNRKCAEDYQIPGTDITLEKDTAVVIPVIGLHYDEEYFPDPEKFDPERFNERNKHKIDPFTYLPFGEGPRVCIGLRFGMMQTKLGLAVLLKNYKFSLNTKTQTPFKMNPVSFILSPLGDIWLDVEKIEE